MLVIAGVVLWLPGEPAEPAPDPDDLIAERLGGLGMLLQLDPLPPALEGCLGDEVLTEHEPLPAPLDELEEALIERVAGLRELTFAEEPELQLITPEEMTAEVARRFGAQQDEADLAAEARTLAALGAVPPGTDLLEWRVHIFAAQVSGLYVGRPDGVMVRAIDPTSLSPLEQVVAAHELQHALSDQRLGRPTASADEATVDARRARLALVEGDATLTMVQLERTALTPQDRATLRDELAARAEEGVLDGRPHYLMDELRWPYREGLHFVCALFAEDGWQAVDRAYDHPPTTSAEVLFPRRYLTGVQPASPPELGTPGADWQQERRAAFGAAELWWLLRAPGGDPQAALDDALQRAAGWNGGEVVTWTAAEGAAGEGTVVGVAIAQREDEEPLCTTLRRWVGAAYPGLEETPADEGAVFSGGDRAVALACADDGVRLGIAPDAAQARAVVG